MNNAERPIIVDIECICSSRGHLSAARTKVRCEAADELSATHHTTDSRRAGSVEFRGVNVRSESNRASQEFRKCDTCEFVRVAERLSKIQTNNTAECCSLLDGGRKRIHSHKFETTSFRSTTDRTDEHQVGAAQHDIWWPLNVPPTLFRS